ncbi:pimeloyl-ACP methyl ester carboxylesterase [Bradyrhizobium sp. USDA 4449]
MVVLLHPITGSAAIWGYQQHALAGAGYRALAYSRRGHEGSSSAVNEKGIGLRDLGGLVDQLGIETLHLLGAGAGGSVALDFALSFPGRVQSVILACTMGGVEDPEFTETTHCLLPAPFSALPNSFQELGPSYRASCPDGVAEWERLSTGPTRPPNPAPTNSITFAALEQTSFPALLIGGDADLYMPPPRKRKLASHLPGSEVYIVPECGHSAHWEQPDAFNRIVLDFLSRRHVA